VQKKIPLVETQVVKRGDIARMIQTTGTVVCADEANVSPKVEQRIVWLQVEEGDRVRAGQVLVRLDTTELDAQMRQAQAEVRVAEARLRDVEAGARSQEIRAGEAAVAQAKAQIAAARSAAEDARRDLERQRQLLAIGGASQQEVDHAQTRYDAAGSQVGVAEAGLAAAQERLSQLKEGATQTQLALAREQVSQARTRLSYWQSQAAFYVIRAPISGVVTRKHEFVGDLASPKAPILTLADTSRTVIRTSVTDEVASRLRVGMPVRAEVDALPGSQPLPLRVGRIYPSADPATRLVTVEMPAPMLAGKVKQGSLARLAMILERHDNAVVVPAYAVVARPGGKLVAFVVERGKAKERMIEPGIESGDRLEILSGLAPGDQLIVRGQERLKEGVEVKVKPPKGKPGGGTGGRR
jgi:multidrug efflux pump subunit AcrA (membrane-fusion protein)